jgi:hypothetical protein
MTARAAWHALRGLRWLLWAAFLGYALVYWLNPQSYHDQFGHLLLSAEMVMYALPVAAVFVGFVEMMMREKAGIIRVPPQGLER